MNDFKSSIAIIIFVLLTRTVVADFTINTVFSLDSDGDHHGIAFDGTNWSIADPFDDSFHRYDANFNFLGDTSVSGISDMRGMAYDSNTNNLFVGDEDTGIVRLVTIDGSEISQFATGFGEGLNAIAFDPNSDSVWLAFFNGVIENRTRTGTLISSFNGGENWTGLAYDELNNSLLLLESSNDTLFEFAPNGSLIGQMVGVDLIVENGQGLAYDSSLGRLFVTSQTGNVAIWDDPSRAIPEPQITIVILLSLAGQTLRRQRD